MLLSRWAICDNEKFKYIKLQESSGLFKETREFKETVGSKYIYRNDLDKTCFEYDMAYADFKDLTKKINVKKKKKCVIRHLQTSNWKYDGYQKKLALTNCKYFDLKGEDTQSTCARNRIGTSDQQLANELHKPTIRKFKKRKL